MQGRLTGPGADSGVGAVVAGLVRPWAAHRRPIERRPSLSFEVVPNRHFAAAIGVEKRREISSKNRHQNLRNGAWETLVTYRMRPALVVSASTRAVGGAIAEMTLSAAVNSGGPTAAAESLRARGAAAEVRQLIRLPGAEFCGNGDNLTPMCVPCPGAHRHQQPQ
jgi:hypothetical protein